VGQALASVILTVPAYAILAAETHACHDSGEMAEWLKAHAWKACIGETLSRVRIPLSPPF
jgi:hypothetical protein